jgi:hypothetical protein
MVLMAFSQLVIIVVIFRVSILLLKLLSFRPCDASTAGIRTDVTFGLG